MPNPQYLICLLLFLVWGADTGAYFVGKAFGRVKLAPELSPGKSWAGVVGGLVTATLIAYGMSFLFADLVPEKLTLNIWLFLVFCLMTASASVLGDLAISLFKRLRRIKDTGKILPGHGGLLDRIDSLLCAAPCFAFTIVGFV